ncbi:MAG TPA: hypothetical protein VGW77_01805 [Candidatus Binatia bacterium]|jgi:hemoglobin-like flavoprotein|nr:hypothetical protein [Candidatus Binatia bacterium]
MALREITRSVITLVENASGCPVVVNEDRSLATLAISRIARGANKIHSISFNPSAVREPDYLICYQCGFILRLFGVPARVDLAGTTEGRQVVHRLLSAPDGPGKKLKLPAESIEALRDQLFEGLMTQLRSIPIGFRVDSWIMREYPELTQLQREMAMRQIKDNLAALSPDIKKIAPKKVYQSNLSMSAAFAEFWARHYADSSLSLPYKAAGYLKVGEELLAILDEVPHEPASDRDLVDAWSERLSLTGWYRWIPYDARQES